MLALRQRDVTDHFTQLFLPVHDLSNKILERGSTGRVVYGDTQNSKAGIGLIRVKSALMKSVVTGQFKRKPITEA